MNFVRILPSFKFLSYRRRREGNATLQLPYGGRRSKILGENGITNCKVMLNIPCGTEGHFESHKRK